jgi:hypothetical protein
VTKVLTKLTTVDPSSDAFRFPFKRDLKTPAAEAAPKIVSLPNIDRVMQGVANFLEAVSATLGQATREKHEGERLDAELEEFRRK